MNARPLRLDDVTLVALDCVAQPLTRLALEDSLAQITPKETLVWTDSMITVPEGAIKVEAKLKSLHDVARALWVDVPLRVKTSHFLVIQWDGWVLDASKWDTLWLDYDYIAAPWWWHNDGLNVGNGGFSLRSTDLMRFVGRNCEKFQPFSPEDVALCRHYRRVLEVYSYNWAPIDVAQDFAFERSEPRATFGFHGSYNWPHVLNKKALYARVSLASGIDYVQQKSDFDGHRLMRAAA